MVKCGSPGGRYAGKPQEIRNFSWNAKLIGELQGSINLTEKNSIINRRIKPMPQNL
jgi:hypothetical protein